MKFRKWLTRLLRSTLKRWYNLRGGNILWNLNSQKRMQRQILGIGVNVQMLSQEKTAKESKVAVAEIHWWRLKRRIGIVLKMKKESRFCRGLRNFGRTTFGKRVQKNLKQWQIDETVVRIFMSQHTCEACGQPLPPKKTP